MPRLSVDVYTISTVDNAPVETVLCEGVAGHIEVDRSAIREDKNSTDLLTVYLFIPDKLYSGFARGQIMKVGTVATYTMLEVRDYETHNEIFCRRQ